MRFVSSIVIVLLASCGGDDGIDCVNLPDKWWHGQDADLIRQVCDLGKEHIPVIPEHRK